MNPYEPPGSEEPSPLRTDPRAPNQLFAVAGVALAAVLGLWGVERLHGPMSIWSPAAIGVAIGWIAGRAQRIEPKRQWLVLSLAITAIALAVGYLLPLGGGAMRILYVRPIVAAFFIVGAEVVRVKWSLDRQESLLIRDADQRVLFARRDAAPLPKPSTAPARFACGACGELFPEAELSTYDGRRRCAECAE